MATTIIKDARLPEATKKIVCGTALHRLADILGPSILYESEAILRIINYVYEQGLKKGKDNG